ncbi:MAG TPA: helix-turn-helix transcriptional regulator, partial [Streptomyces sp.]|uniref:helix-turn-helix domain-containing protein n=1 Tax=Streptomyces sp. TaxID=1931 RepID=UPI002D341B4D
MTLNNDGTDHTGHATDGTERTDHATDGADESCWEEEWDDEYGPVVKAAARQIKLWRTAAGLTQLELGKAIGYSLGMVSAVERTKRLP